MFPRQLRLPPDPTENFFLWGPRQAGKTSLLRATYPHATWIDLLKTDEFARYARRPALLREEVPAVAERSVVVIDEFQKVPALLDEVHWLIENCGTRFARCGSSARKVRRGAANLLGGRAVRHELLGLVSAEIGAEFGLVRALNHGYLPRHYLSGAPGTPGPGIGAVRQGLRELGVSRAELLPGLPPALRRAGALAAGQRDRGGLLAGLRELVRDQPGLRRRIVVCLAERPRRTEDGIDILPAADFAARLWGDRLLPG